MTLWLKRCLLFIGTLCLLVGAGIGITMFGQHPNASGLLTLCGIVCLIGLTIWNNKIHRAEMRRLEQQRLQTEYLLRRYQKALRKQRKEGP